MNLPLLAIFCFNSIDDKPLALISLFSIYLLISQLNALFVVFSTITLEKEYHMEEMMLTRISYSDYYLPKLKHFFYQTIKPLSIGYIIIIAEIIVLVLNNEIREAGIMFMFCFLIIVQITFFTSILFSIWRLFPSKNLIGSTVLTIIGIESLLYFFIYIIRPRKTLIPTIGDIVYIQAPMIIVSPMLSNITLSYWIFNYDAIGLLIVVLGKFLVSLMLVLFSYIIFKCSIEY